LLSHFPFLKYHATSFLKQFGDISRKLDKVAKTRVKEITGQKDYKFGDLTRWADAAAKERAAKFTGKENYQASVFF